MSENVVNKRKSKSGFIILVIIVIISIIVSIYMVSRYKKVETGKVAVVYSVKGGVKDDYLTEGRHFISPFQELHMYSISNEQLVLSKDEREGSRGDDSFRVATSDNANIAISFQMSYRYYPEKVVQTFKSFKGMDGEEIVDNRVKTVLKSKISEITTNYSLMDIYSGDRSKINKELTDYLNKEFTKSYNMEVIDASIIDVHPDENLRQAIDARVAVDQEKEKAEKEQETIQVQMENKRIQADKENQIKLEKAENEKQIKIKQAEAEAEANKMIAESITKELIELKEAEARLEHGWVTIQGTDPVVVANVEDQNSDK